MSTEKLATVTAYRELALQKANDAVKHLTFLYTSNAATPETFDALHAFHQVLYPNEISEVQDRLDKSAPIIPPAGSSRLDNPPDNPDVFVSIRRFYIEIYYNMVFEVIGKLTKIIENEDCKLIRSRTFITRLWTISEEVLKWKPTPDFR